MAGLLLPSPVAARQFPGSRVFLAFPHTCLAR